MASTRRYRPRSLIDELATDGSRFRFFQAVRLLALQADDGGRCLGLPPKLRFGSPLSLAFPPSEILAVDIPQQSAEEGNTEEVHQRMVVGFLGMTGPSGAMPTAYTELLIERQNQFRDTAGHDFLDIFTHRVTALFYQAWRKYRFYLPYEAGDQTGFSRHLLDLIGIGLQHLRHRLEKCGRGIPDQFLIHYAGILSQKPMSAANLAAVVRGYFGVSVDVEQFVGQWMILPVSEQTALGGSACVLGENTVVGERQWDRQTKFCLRLGPLNRADFTDFLPGQSGLDALRELIQFCVGFTLDCDVNLILQQVDIPAPRLETQGENPLQLGYNVWLNSQPAQREAGDARFTLLDENRRF